MEESREESNVSLLRLTEFSLPLSTAKNPNKRHSFPEDSSMAWCSFKNPKSVKAWGCNEFDDFITKPDSSQDFCLLEKRGRLETAIRVDSEFEREECKNENASGDLKEKKLKLKEELNTLKFNRMPNVLPCGKTDIISESGRHDMNSPLNLSADPEDQTGDGVDIKAGKNLGSVVEKLTMSAFVGNQLERTSSYLDPAYIDPQDITNMALVDVHLTVKASCRVENVPYVCLTSQLNGKGILGYPLEIGELSHSSETSLSGYESACCELFSREGNSWPRLVWRTSKRTPVCYVTNSLFSSISKNVLPGVARKNVKEKYFKKLPKNPSHFKQGRAALSRTCVPVQYVFSKIRAAVGQGQY